MSTATKRKWADIGSDNYDNHYDDDDEEEPSFGRQSLPVANMHEDFDGDPQDGQEYLFIVRRAARKLPHVTRVPNPYQIAEDVEAPSQPESSSRTIHAAIPSEEWRASFEKRFRNFRKNILQSTIYVHGSKDSVQNMMPDKRERDLWWAFIEGRPESDWNPPKQPQVRGNAIKRQRMHGFPDYSVDGPDEHDRRSVHDAREVQLVDPSDLLETPLPLEIPSASSPNQNKPREPTPSLLRRIDHRMALHLLMYFTHWINLHLQQPDPPSAHMTETHSRWIFALLSRVEEYVTADDMSLLRNLARACLALMRKTHPKQRCGSADENSEASHVIDTGGMAVMSEHSCWMILAAVAGVWGQRDLWMDAESMLSSTAG